MNAAMTSARRGLAASLLLALAGCAAQPLHFHTLLPAATPTTVPPANFSIDVRRVQVPVQLDHPELVLRQSDGQLTLVESRRWSAPFPDEVRAALAAELTAALGASNISAVAEIPQQPVYRVLVDVQRFDARAGQSVNVAAVWSLRLIEQGRERGSWTCPTQIERPAADGYDALVDAAQQAVSGVADDIAALIRAVQRDPKTAACKR